MSFRLFVYYSALAGAASALVGWVIGRLADTGQPSLLGQGLKGMYLGLCLALALSLVDGLWNTGVGRPFSLFARVFCASTIGAMAGLLGGVVGESLYESRKDDHSASWEFIRVVGYLLIGLLIGAALGLFDLVGALLANRNPRPAIRKIRNGLLGGTLGGMAGGLLSMLLHGWWGTFFRDRPADQLLSPSAIAFAALGFFIGLFIGLAQVLLKEAWLRVIKGFRTGRELILTRNEITIGRAESCDIGLFGDPTVEKVHARIVRQGTEYLAEDAGTPTGTYVNDERITGPRRLYNGDEIRVGRCILRFGERAKR